MTISVNWASILEPNSFRFIGIPTLMRFTVVLRRQCHVDIEFPAWEVNGEFNLPPQQSIDDTPIVFIDSDEGIINLIATLKTHRCISVNVIQHSYRSYLGYCSMIMVSTAIFCDK